MGQRPEILIIGGGVIGLTTALNLAQQRASVTVVDRQQVGQEASWAGAGMLPPGNLSGATTAEARLRAYSDQFWDELSAQLRTDTSIDNGYRRCSAVEVFAADEESAFETQVSAWQTEGIRVKRLNRRDLEKHVPALSEKFQSGALLPDFGQARNPRHVKALAAACRQRGVDIIEDANDLQLKSADGETVTASTSTRQFDADRICITAGSWSTPILDNLNVALPVKPVRGQMAQLRLPQLPFSCVVEQGRRYLVPRSDGLILVGATEEHVGFEKRNTSAGISGLLQFAEQIAPELKYAELVRCWAGLRPGSPDELPFLGAVSGFHNLFIGAGHFRSGLQMSPGTGRILCDLLLDREPEIKLDGLLYDPRRWAATSVTA